jgi:hypothetical protein
VLPSEKALASAFAQDPNSQPIFPVDLDVEMETPASLRVLAKKFLEDLWHKYFYIICITLVLNDLQIFIGQQVPRCQHFHGMMSQPIQPTTPPTPFSPPLPPLHAMS